MIQYLTYLLGLTHHIYFLLGNVLLFLQDKVGYKPVYSQFTTTHYVSTNKIIYVYGLINNICGWSYKLSHSRL